MTVLLLTLVLALIAVVTRFSWRALDGDPGRPRFIRNLLLTGAAVAALILATNALAFTAAWILTSLGLHRLLVFYGDRPGARLAARKKFVVSRLGDLCLAGALWIAWREFGTWNFDAMFAAADRLAAAPGGAPASLQGLGLLLAGAAIFKSAQFPFHSWLPDTMETPTPVSALMHAGVINAGGILLIRCSPLMAHAPAAMTLLVVVGAVTAAFAAVVMLTQASIKRQLAFSTVAQMGFMLFECGLGLYSLATLHLVAHSLYKAFAFLSSGDAIAAVTPSPRAAGPAWFATIAAAMAAIGITAALSVWLDARVTASAGTFAVAALFTAAMAVLIAAIWRAPTAARLAAGVAMPTVLTAAYLLLHHAFDLLAPASVAAPLTTPAMAMIVAATFGLYLLNAAAPALAERPWAHRLYVHARNGFYINTLANRLAAGRALRRPAGPEYSA